MWDTLAIEECTWSALVCVYWMRPKAAPIAQITMPRYISVTPLTPPKPSKWTCVSSGILMSASPARSDGRTDAAKSAAIRWGSRRRVMMRRRGCWGNVGCGERVIRRRANFASPRVEKSRLSVGALPLCALMVFPLHASPPFPPGSPRFPHQWTNSRHWVEVQQTPVPRGAEGRACELDHDLFEVPPWVQLSPDENREDAPAPEVRPAGAGN